MTTVEQARRWWFAGLAVVLALWVSWAPLSSSTGAPPVAPPPAHEAHHPAPGRPDSSVRDPFLTGSEWRARVRERLEPNATPTPVPSASAAAPAAREPAPDLVVLGTMISGRDRFAVTASGMFKQGTFMGKYKVESVDIDRVVFESDGHTFVVKVAGSSRSATSSGQ